MEHQNTQIITRQSAAADSTVCGKSFAPAQKKTSYILVVTRNGHMAEPVMDYALNVADRLKYRILAVHINTLPFYRDGGRRSGLFASAMQESALLFREKAEIRGLQVEHLGDAGKIGNVVNRLCHSERHIEFVVIDQGIRMEEVAAQSPVPVFSVIYTQAKAGRTNTTTHHKPRSEGVSRMSTTSRKRHVKNCFVFGALTVGVYAAVFINQDLVMTYFTKGGIYALLPVAVVFAVSYAHGNFSSSFWSALGIEGSKVAATKQVDIRKDETDSAGVRKDIRPRAQVSV
ncbi:MAG: universal stress protein [Desulfoprunum sp.]|nr:universal stress protein [Desulfoprunum sp.]